MKRRTLIRPTVKELSPRQFWIYQYIKYISENILPFNADSDNPRSGVALMQQWLCLFARTWGLALFMTREFCLLEQGFSTQQSNPNANTCAMCRNGKLLVYLVQYKGVIEVNFDVCLFLLCILLPIQWASVAWC